MRKIFRLIAWLFKKRKPPTTTPTRPEPPACNSKERCAELRLYRAELEMMLGKKPNV